MKSKIIWYGMELKGKKVLLTGADSFIGNHVVDALLEEGC